MKICFENIPGLEDGIRLLTGDLKISVAAREEADVTVSAETADSEILKIDFEDRAAKIVYGRGKARFFRALGLLTKAVRDGKTALHTEEHPLFTVNGAMVDMSRDAVMNVPTVEFTMRKMALMGLNTYMLYTEDTYEVDTRPYFGYMRGRYTADEIRTLDAYAAKLGIELVPCIQTLGHLATYLRWAEAAPYKDSANALLVGSDETYRFIDDLFRNIAACFTSRRLHMGMDETHDLGTGRSLDLFGYHERKDLYFEHLNRVVEIARRYGFRPMMWSDMFFRLSAGKLPGYGDYDMRTVLLPNIRDLIPDGVQQIFWDYYRPNEEFYAVNLEKHDQLGENTMFAGGIWAWSGHAVQYSRSIRNSIPALEACRKKGTHEVVATIWHNGAEASLLMALAGLQMYAEFDYHGHYDVDEIRAGLEMTCGVRYDDFLATEAVEYPHGDNSVTGASRALLYNDPMVGLVDAHAAKIDAGGYYRALTPKLAPLSKDKGEFAYGFEILAALSSFLENKADFGVRLKAAYDAGDRDALAALKAECAVMLDKLDVLRRAHRASWMRWNKPFGWEVHDIRYGGLAARINTCAERLGDYLEGRCDRLEELEAKRLRIDGLKEDAAPFTGRFLWNQYTTYCTCNRL